MNWITWVISAGYILTGILWVWFIEDKEYWDLEYCEYVYHGLFWPVSLFIYLIGDLHK